MSAPRVIREKETFKTEKVVAIEGEDIRFFVKCSVNFERLTYKVTPVITITHKKSKEFDQALLESVALCRTECLNRLDTYRDETGIGTQSELGFGEPAGEAAY